ncbi:hypothetical protein JNW90_17940 [Micromonospora sp. STR1s_5]|nr:hypothetical protein [Micromonospora sp. STR1s_5]
MGDLQTQPTASPEHSLDAPMSGPRTSATAPQRRAAAVRTSACVRSATTGTGEDTRNIYDSRA